MAINKKLIHFESFSNFNSLKLSANKENTQYTIGIDGTIQTGSPDILYQSIVYIKDTLQQWTHGLIYDGKHSSETSGSSVYTFYYNGLSSITQEEWDAMQLAEVIQLNIWDLCIPAHVVKQSDEVSFIIANMDILPIFDTYDSVHIISISDNLQVIVEHANRSVLNVPIINTINKKLNLSNTSKIRENCAKLLPWLSMTFMISDSNGNCFSRDTVYIDTEEMKLHLFHSASNTAVRLLFTNGEAYYHVEGFNIPLIGNIAGGWYSQSISKWITLPETPLQTARVGDFITFTRVDVPASDFYSKYIDFDGINLELSTMDRVYFDAYKSKLGLSSLSDGLFIKFLIVNGYIHTCLYNPQDSPSAVVHPLAVDGMVTTYIAQITPNTENFYSGEFWTGNMTGPGIYSYITSGRPEGSEDGELYTGYVSPDGTQTLVSMKNPSNTFTRDSINDTTWLRVGVGRNFYFYENYDENNNPIGEKIQGTGEIFNDYINNGAHPDHGHAEGQACSAEGWNSHAEGFQTVAGEYGVTGNAHSEGNNTWAAGNNSHAEGVNTVAEGHNSHAEGDSTIASNWNAHAEGYRTYATGNGAHAEGNSDGITNENYWNVASGFASHTEGNGTRATNKASHAEGISTSSEGQGSHSEGLSTRSIGTASHAEGINTWASGNASHAEGYRTVAKNEGGHAEGTYNYHEINNLIHSVGIGNNEDNRINAHAITLDGKHYIYGVGGYEGKGIENVLDLASVVNNCYKDNNLIPKTHNTYDIGSSTTLWKTIYCDKLNAQSGVYQTSDLTKKNIISDVYLNIKDIANAPSVKFSWKNNPEQIQVGTIAQYWKNVLPEVIRGEEGTYSVDYATLATVNSILLAKKVVELEETIQNLKTELSEIKQILENLLSK